MANQRVIEILLQFKKAGEEIVAQAASAIQALAPAAQQAQQAVAGMAQTAAQTFAQLTGPTVSFKSGLQQGAAAATQLRGTMVSFGTAAQSAAATSSSSLNAVKGVVATVSNVIPQAGGKFAAFGSVARAALSGVRASLLAVQAGAEAVWGAITFGISTVLKIGSSLLSFLNPFKIQGLLTGAALGGTGLVAKNWIEAADGVETYRKRLGIVINDQAIANRIFDDFEALSQKSGVEAEKLADTFTRLFDLRVKDAQAATSTLAGVSALLQTDIAEITDILNNPNARGLARFGINLDSLGTQVRLQSGNITKLVDNTEQAIRQGIIDLFAEKFPDALAIAGQSFATQVAIFRVQLGQFAQDFGAILLPAATEALTRINQFLDENRDKIVAVVRSIPEIAGIAYAEINKLLDSGKIATTLLPLLEPLNKLVERLLDSLLRIFIAGLKLLAVPLAATWRVALAELQALWEGFTENLVPTLINSIKHGLAAVARDPKVQGLLNVVAPGAGVLAAGVGAIPDLPVTPLEDTAKGFLGRLDTALDASVKDAKAATTELATAFKNLFNYLRQDSGAVGGVLANLFGPQLTQMGQTVRATLSRMRAAAQENRSSEKPVQQPGLASADDLFRISQLSRGDFDQQIAAIERARDDEIAAIKARLKDVQDGAELSARAEVGIRAEAGRKIAEIERQKAIVAQQAAVAVAAGIEQMVAQNHLSYEQDLANWEKRWQAGDIDQEAFLAIQDSLRQRLEQQNAALLDQLQAAQDQANLLILQSQHRVGEAQLQQIEIEGRSKKAALRRQHDEGLLDEQTYQAALQAVDRQSAEKRLEIDGDFFDGLRLGFQQAYDSLLTQAQMGKQVAANFAGGLADAFTSIITGSQSAAEAFKRFALSIIADIARMVIEAQILMFLKSVFPKLFGANTGGVVTGAPGEVALPGGRVATANRGGWIQHFLGGGRVPGHGPNVDTVPALLTKGEFVVQQPVVRQPGMLDFLQELNAGRVQMRAQGGLMDGIAAGMPGLSDTRREGPSVLPVLVGNDSSVRKFLAGGRNAFIDFVRSNRGAIKAVLD